MCCTRLAGNTGCKNDAKNRHLGTIAQLCSAVTIFSNDIEIATLDQNRKKIESSILPSESYDFHEK